MKSNADLLNQYKEEKTIVIGSLDERTGLEEFPSYKAWKADYIMEYNETHNVDNPLTMEEAVALADAEVEAAGEAPEEDLLAQLVALGDESTEEKEDDAQAPTEATPKVATKPKPQPAKKAAPKKTSKAAAAQVVFDSMYPRVLAGTATRKSVIDELVAEVKLTANGAATYYQKMKKAAAAA